MKVLKKIAFVTPYYYPLTGGVQEYVYNLKEEYKSLGYNVKVITGNFGDKCSDEKDVIRIGKGVAIKANGSTSRIIFMSYKKRIKQILDEEQFDILHFQEPFIPFLSHKIIFYSKGINIATFHANFESNIFYAFSRFLLKYLWKKLNGRIAVSKSAKNSINKYFSGSVEIIPNGVDTKRFTPNNPKIKFFDDGIINILFVGRIEERKGLIYLIKAYKIAKKNNANIRLIIVGTGPLQAECEKYIQKEEIKDIYFEGFVSSEQLVSYYSTAQIFCSPAIFGESFGIVLLEAMASMVSVIAFNISGYNDVISDGTDGLLANIKDINDMAEKLEILIKDESLRKQIAKNGFEKAHKFTWKNIAKQNIEFYKNFIQVKA